MLPFRKRCGGKESPYFLSRLAPSSEEELTASFTKFLQPYSTDSHALGNIIEIAEHYLAEPNSPYRNEDLYIAYLNALLSLPNVSDDQLIRPRMQLERVMKNRPGTLATDFQYTTREGKTGTLLSTEVPLLVLVFYDLPAMPTIYLLDEDKRVLLKDSTPADLELYLSYP